MLVPASLRALGVAGGRYYQTLAFFQKPDALPRSGVAVRHGWKGTIS